MSSRSSSLAPASCPRRPGAALRRLAIGGILAALPFFWMIFGAFKTGAEIRQIPPTFVPQEWTLDNFTTILNDPTLPLATFYRNSLFVAVTNVVITLFTSSMLGFIFAKYAFRGRDVLFWYLMAMMMVPPSVADDSELPDPQSHRAAQQLVGTDHHGR